ncbi:MAG: translation initiation factor IF-2 N-terminal domain-containing protein [Corynebacterium sp.]|nr:translation initiation factor IF-2 N-terminal domain-containing protein [Corynebacterium sp.]
MAGSTGKIRVHALARELGMSSKELVLKLHEIGLVKVAQSTLTAEEVDAIRNFLADNEAEAPADNNDEKLRDHIRKNVENEIHQIEQKVDLELASSDPAPTDLAEEPSGETESVVETPQAPGSMDTIFLAPTVREPEPEPEPEPAPAKPVKAAEKPRRGARGTGRGRGAQEQEPITEPVAIKGSTRLEALRRRRTNLRSEGRKKRHVVSQAEFLARRESVDRVMVVRERRRNDDLGNVTQVGVLEDDLLVEHFVTSETQNSTVGNIYLGRVQNVLPSMEAAFIDIGTGRNGVLYAGEVDWRAAGLGGRNRTIEHALKPGDQVLVQVAKDPVGQKGARLTTQISLAGRYLVYVPHGNSSGISRKLPEDERKRLRDLVKDIVPPNASAIIRTAAEGVSERDIAADVARLQEIWESIEAATKKAKAKRGSKPRTLYEEPDMLVKIVRDVFNEDFSKLVVEGQRPWSTVKNYVETMAPDLMDRVERYLPEKNAGVDVFERYRIDEQLQKALSRKVWLPSGGTLIIDRTEAMTVIDVNTGRFTGSGGNLEETVTRNNLEAAEEIVRQMRLRDLGGMIVVDFIDMVLPENQELVLRRLREFLGRDRTRHQVSEVTSLGLVQMTRKKLGQGLLETFATQCECCSGTGYIIHPDPVEHAADGITPISPDKHKKKREDRKPKKKGPTLQIKEEDVLNEESALEQTPAEIPQKKERGLSQSGRSEEPTGENSRRSAREESRDSSPSIVDIALAAVENAEQQDPDDEFGKVMRDWESNPRRRRATRGNSRSDKRPEGSIERNIEKQRGVKTSKPKAELEPETVGPVRVIRGRRRAVRRASSATTQETAKAESLKTGGVKVSADTPTKVPISTRKRRRAVRKTRG